MAGEYQHIQYLEQHWHVIRHVWNDREYEKRRPILRDDVVVDAGAHVGAFTVKAALKARMVYAFEPEHENYEYLELNTRRFDNIKVYRKALWNSNGHTWLNITEDTERHSIHAVDKKQFIGRELVETTRLDEAVNDKIDFLKVDVEGSELEVLQGAHRILAAYKPYIAMEIHSEQIYQTVIMLLRQYGYSTKTLEPNKQYGITYFE